MKKLEAYLKSRKRLGPVYGLLISLGDDVELRLWDASGHEEHSLKDFGLAYGEGLHCFKYEDGNIEIL